MPIHWDNTYATGDEKIDEHHRQLFRFTNKLEELLNAPTVPPDQVEQLLLFLQTYINSHFRYEEACMLKRHCPVAQKNRDAHLAFQDFFQNAHDEYQSQGFSHEWLARLHNFIASWLSSHICEIDAQLRHCQK